MPTNEVSSKSRSFVSYVTMKISSDTKSRADLSRGDNADTASRAWEYLVAWCDLTNERERLAYALIAASLAKGRITTCNGHKNLGECLGMLEAQNSSDSDNEQRRLSRLIACDTPQELMNVVRPILSYLQSKGVGEMLDYALTLDHLLHWGENVKIKWCQGFFSKYEESEEETNDSTMNINQTPES